MTEEYKRHREAAKDHEELLYDVYVWMVRALEKGYDMPDKDFEQLQKLYDRLSFGPKLGAHIKNLLDTVEFQGEILSYIEIDNVAAIDRAIDVYHAKRKLKGE